MRREGVHVVFVAVVAAIAIQACKGEAAGIRSRLPLSPSVVAVPAPPPVPKNAKPLAIGQALTAVLRGSDPICPDLEDPMNTYAPGGPCQTYQVTTPPANGTLTIQVTWDSSNANTLCVLYAIRPNAVTMHCGKSPIDFPVMAAGGQPYGFGIVLIASGPDTTLASDTKQQYTLSVNYRPSSSAGSEVRP